VRIGAYRCICVYVYVIPHRPLRWSSRSRHASTCMIVCLCLWCVCLWCVCLWCVCLWCVCLWCYMFMIFMIIWCLLCLWLYDYMMFMMLWCYDVMMLWCVLDVYIHKDVYILWIDDADASVYESIIMIMRMIMLVCDAHTNTLEWLW
jgi:hypothetical protein